MSKEKRNIAILLGDPSGIGPELVSKLLIREGVPMADRRMRSSASFLSTIPRRMIGQLGTS